MKKIIEVPYIDQTEQYPTGCESISAVMMLSYLGYDITPERFIDRCLYKRDFEFYNGYLYGPHPDDAFIGSPYNDEKGSYGCYAPVIALAMERAAGEDYQFTARKGVPMEQLLETYIDRNMPVVFWATLNMEPSSLGMTWRLLGRDGEFQWINHQHCILLVGYDEKQYYFNDPWMNAGCRGYDRKLVEQRYREMGMQVVTAERRQK